MKRKKTVVVLIFVIIIGLPSVTAKERKKIDQNIEDDLQIIKEESELISPSPYYKETESEKPLVIAPVTNNKEVDVPNSSVDKSDLIISVGAPILAMICLAASTSIALFVLYKKK